MKLSVILFKDSNCDLCKLMQQELIINPPAADVTIVHVNRESCDNEATSYNVEHYPTTLLVDEDKNVVNRFEGFIDTKNIDINIKEYESKYLV